MKRWIYLCYLLGLFILLFIPSLPARCQHMTPMERKCQQESEKGSVRCLEWQAIKILSMSGGNKGEIKKAIDILNKAHVVAPNDLSILSNLATCYIQMHDYGVALRYVDKVLALKQQKFGVKEPTLLQCMLQERLSFPRPQYNACYRAVVEWHQNRGETDSVDYVYAVLMAETPNCEQVKAKFLASQKPGSGLAKMWNQVLKNFDRKKYLHTILP